MNIKDWISIFGKEQEYVIWGCTEFAEALIATVRDIMKIRYIVDSNKELDGSSFQDIPVYMPERLQGEDGIKVIVTNRFSGTRNNISMQLKKWGFRKNVDFTYYENIISAWSWFYKNQIAASYMEINITNFCSLKCKKCAAYVPYINYPAHRDIDKIRKDLSAFFGIIDWCARFRILGGEPLLHPDLETLLYEIYENYGNQIGELTIVTNGTVMPSPVVLEAVKKTNANFSISEYSACGHVLTRKEQYDKLERLLDKNKISYFLNTALRWMDLGNPTVRQDLNEEQLRVRFEDCRLDRRGLADGKIFACANLLSAYLGHLADYSENDVLDLAEAREMPREEFYNKWRKFDIEGIHGKGYLEFCRYCNGEGALNSNFIPVAEQCAYRKTMKKVY